MGVHAATDVTGFGVLGHTLGMAEASGVTIRLNAAAVPWIEGLEAHATDKNTCGGLNRNLAYAKELVTWTGGTELQRAVLADPQTSGGLLISVASDKLDALLAALEARNVSTRAVVGGSRGSPRPPDRGVLVRATGGAVTAPPVRRAPPSRE